MNIAAFLSALFMSSATLAQVVNDDISHRLTLPLNQALNSTTTNCTVQWKCVDTKAVTGCILFHNDQWFEFTTVQAGTYYLTVTNQDCRDIRGVQVLVIEGEPCKPTTYQHLVCHSTGSQDNISLTLDSLQANRTYLVNIDGYLNDFCRFELTLQTHIPDFAIFSLPASIPVTAQSQDSIVSLQWSVPDSLQEELTDFYILRRHYTEKKSTEIIRFPAEANAFGIRQSAYLQTDTINKEGIYTYKIVGSTNQQKNFLLNESTVQVEFTPHKILSPDDILTVEIPVRKKINAHVLLINAQTDKLLKKTYILTSSKHPNSVQFNIEYFRKQGIRNYKVIVQELDKPRGYSKTFLFNK